MNFNDLKFGLDGERRLTEKYPFLLTLGKNREGDFQIEHTKITAELKCDSYDPARYPNIIIERYSYDEEPGGPWQAKKHGCRYFMYYFAKADLLFVFDVVQLLARLKKIIKKKNLKLQNISNRDYITRIYKVPILELQDLNLGIEKLQRLHDVAAARKARTAKNVRK